MLQKDLFGEEFDVDVTKKRKNWRAFKFALLEQYGDVCYLCKEVIDERDCEIDHVIPLKHRGPDEWHNLRPTHWYCNKAKRAMMPDDPNLQAVIDMIPVKIKEAVRQNNCIKCNTDISHRGRGAYVCDECKEEHKRAMTRKWQKEHYDNDSAYRTKTLDVAKAWQKENKERVNARSRERYAEKKGGPVRPYRRKK